jgi:hypothetical protein
MRRRATQTHSRHELSHDELIFNNLSLSMTWRTPPSQQRRLLNVHHQRLLPLLWTEPDDVAVLVAVVAVTSVATSSTSAAA